MLSVLCIVLFMWIIVRLRNQSKNRAGMNGIALSTASTTTTSPPPPRIAVPPVRYIDLHEMQTLIATSETPYESLQSPPNCSAASIRQSGKHNSDVTLMPSKAPIEANHIDPLLKFNFVFSSTPKKEQPKVRVYRFCVIQTILTFDTSSA